MKLPHPSFDKNQLGSLRYLTGAPSASEEIVRKQVQEKQDAQEAAQLMARLLARGIQLTPQDGCLEVSPLGLLGEEDIRQLTRHGERVAAMLRQVLRFATGGVQ